MHTLEIKLNPNYPVLKPFPYQDTKSIYYDKVYQLAIEIGNCILKVGNRADKTLLRKLKKFFIKTRWFKKVRIIRNQLFLFRRKGRFAIRLTRPLIYNLSCLAKEKKAEKLLRASS